MTGAAAKFSPPPRRRCRCSHYPARRRSGRYLAAPHASSRRGGRQEARSGATRRWLPLVPTRASTLCSCAIVALALCLPRSLAGPAPSCSAWRIFERGYIAHSLANRSGKAKRAVIDADERYRDRHRIVRRIAMFRYFPAVDQAILKAELRRRSTCTGLQRPRESARHAGRLAPLRCASRPAWRKTLRCTTIQS